MRKVFKISGAVVLLVFIAAIAGYIYFSTSFPKIGPAKDIKIQATKERLQRGEYLANHVTVCMDCHSTRDWTRFTGPLVRGTEGRGGERYDRQLGIPGTLYARNITPHNLKNWTDGEIIRVITSGVTKDGRVLFPLMPYPNFSQMSEEDLYSVVAYIRTLKPIESRFPDSELDFPVNFIVKTIPQPYVAKKSPDKSNTVEYGKYLVTIAGCADCHTPSVKGEPVQGMSFAGGSPMKLPWGTVRPANITPDNETGIGSWRKEDFIRRFKTFASDSSMGKVNSNEFNTVMPWSFFAGMTEEDLGAIYDYLRTVKPVKNNVVRFSPFEKMEAVK